MLLLPNIEFAYIPSEKLAGYALNPDHPVGKHKAAVFESVLGMTSDFESHKREQSKPNPSRRIWAALRSGI